MWSLIVSTTLRNRSFSPGMLRLPSSSAIASITFGGAVEECDVTAVAEVRSCWFFGPQPEAGGGTLSAARLREAPSPAWPA